MKMLREKATPEFEHLRELAERLGLNYRTVWRAVQEGRVRVVKFGGSLLVPKREVERILAQGW